MLRLTVLNGHFQGLALDVTDSVTIGRAQDSGLFLPDPQVSRRHSRVFREEGRLWINDEGSHNGTFVNEVKTEGNRVLKDGDRINIGNTLLQVELGGEDSDSGAIRIEEETNEVTMTMERDAGELSPPTIEALASQQYIDGFNFPSVEELRSTNDSNLALILANAKRFAILFHMARGLQESNTAEKLLATMMDHVFKVMDADRGDIVLLGEKSGEMLPVLSINRKGEVFDTVRVSKTVMKRVLDSKKAVISTDARSDPRLCQADSIIMYGMRSIMSVPMISKDKVVGVIHVVNDRDFAAFGEDDLYLLTVFASLAAVSVENTRLYEEQQRAIEELETAHKELMQTQEELVQRERLASVGQMASGIAHEIRNTLGPIALVHLLKERYPDDKLLQEYSNMILESHNRILAIIDEVRNFSKGDAQHYEAIMQPLRPMIESVLEFLKFDKDVKQAQVELRLEAEPLACFNLDRIKQVIINLVRNAAQALEGADQSIKVRVSQDEEWARIEVTDTGRGISPENLEKIWTPFFTTKGERGMGLGLDISRMIVEQHGGRIGCTSELGKGTTMSVELPPDCSRVPKTDPDEASELRTLQRMDVEEISQELEKADEDTDES